MDLMVRGKNKPDTREEWRPPQWSHVPETKPAYVLKGGGLSWHLRRRKTK